MTYAKIATWPLPKEVKEVGQGDSFGVYKNEHGYFIEVSGAYQNAGPYGYWPDMNGPIWAYADYIVNSVSADNKRIPDVLPEMSETFAEYDRNVTELNGAYDTQQWGVWLPTRRVWLKQGLGAALWLCDSKQEAEAKAVEMANRKGYPTGTTYEAKNYTETIDADMRQARERSPGFCVNTMSKPG